MNASVGAQKTVGRPQDGQQQVFQKGCGLQGVRGEQLRTTMQDQTS